MCSNAFVFWTNDEPQSASVRFSVLSLSLPSPRCFLSGNALNTRAVCVQIYPKIIETCHVYAWNVCGSGFIQQFSSNLEQDVTKIKISSKHLGRSDVFLSFFLSNSCRSFTQLTNYNLKLCFWFGYNFAIRVVCRFLYFSLYFFFFSQLQHIQLRIY